MSCVMTSLTHQVSLHLTLFIILLCLTQDDFTDQRESTCAHWVIYYTHVSSRPIESCLSDVGILDSGASCKCLKLTAIISQKVLCMLLK